MESPNNNVWGPALWLILHSSCERIGYDPKKINDEIRIWYHLLLSLRFSLPCPLCKKHYQSYIQLNPITNITKDNIRIWLYKLHTYINQSLNKDNMTFEGLIEHYSKEFCFTYSYQIINHQITLALQLGRIIREDAIRTLRLLEELKILYDLR